MRKHFFSDSFFHQICRSGSKGAIAVKVVAIAGDEAVTPQKLSGAFRMENSHAIVAALLESWSGGKIPGFLQLDRMKLAQLLAILTVSLVLHG